jgi:hypothetical protein
MLKGNSTDLSYDMSLSSARKLQFYYNGHTGTWPYKESISAVPLNQWSHLVITYDRSNVRFYINGNLDNTAPLSVSLGKTISPVTIGCDIAGSLEWFQGSIDDVRIYNRALSSEQVFAQYQGRNDLLVSQETDFDDIWQVSIIPNDGYGDGMAAFSNTVSIQPNFAPVADSVLLTSDSGYNHTTDNLTLTWGASDTNNDSIRNITNWYQNGGSLMALNMPFEGGSNYTFTRDYSGNNRNGTVNGVMWNATGGPDGSGAYYFNGNNEIDAGTFNPPDPSHITMTAWVYPESCSSNAI